MTDQQPAPFDPSDADWDALARFVAGEGTAEERAAAARLLEAHPARAALVRALTQVVRVDEPVPPNAAEVDAALAFVRSRAQQDPRIAEVPRRAAVVSLDVYRRRWRSARFAAAAAVLVVAGAGLLARVYIADRTPRALGARKDYATAPGVIDSLTLPDGSHVLLGAGSRLSLAAGFGSPTREMTLVGEARFSVAHDTAHAFVIHTSAGTVRDVGTVFSVHSDEAEGARIVVSEGAVEVQEKSGVARQTLGAGDVAVIAVGGGIRVQRAAAVADDAAWTQGRLVFHDASVAEVTSDLRRWYGVEVKVDSALATRPVTANFDRGLSAADVARIVAATIGGALKEEGGVLHIVSLQAGATAK